MINKNLYQLQEAMKENPEAPIIFQIDSDIEKDYFGFALTKIYNAEVIDVIILDPFTYISKYDTLETAFDKIPCRNTLYQQCLNKDSTINKDKFLQFIKTFPVTRAIIVNLENLGDNEKN